MEDKVIRLSADYYDSTTGEIIIHSQKCVPISQLNPDMLIRHYNSFMRGLHLDKNIGILINLVLDRDFPKQLDIKFDVY